MAFNFFKVLDHASYGMNSSSTKLVILMLIDLSIIVPLNIIYFIKFILTLSGCYREAYIIAFLIMCGISIITGFIALYDFCNGPYFGIKNFLSIFDLVWIVIGTF